MCQKVGLYNYHIGTLPYLWLGYKGVMHKGRPILWSQTLARTKYYKNFAKHFDRVLWYLFNNS